MTSSFSRLPGDEARLRGLHRPYVVAAHRTGSHTPGKRWPEVLRCESWLGHACHQRRLALAVEKEQQWLPILAPSLPLRSPSHWRMAGRLRTIHIHGRSTSGSPVNQRQPIASPLPSSSPLNGRTDVDRARAIWIDARDALSDGTRRWFHGDVAQGNLLLDGDGQLAAVIDFGTCGVGTRRVTWQWRGPCSPTMADRRSEQVGGRSSDMAVPLFDRAGSGQNDQRGSRSPTSSADRLGDRGERLPPGTKKGSPGGSLGQYAFSSSGLVGRFEAL